MVLNRDSVAEVRTLTARASSAGLAAVDLVSRDRVSVRAIPNWQPDESVVLEENSASLVSTPCCLEKLWVN